MIQKLIKITPNDTMFFRDGKPFDKGESKWHLSMLMPNPSVLYGAIFSEILRQNSKIVEDDKFYNELGEHLKIKAIYLYNDVKDEIYLPAPLDLFENEKGDIRYGNFEKEDEDKENLLMYSPYLDDYKFERVDGKFIKLSNIKNGYFKRKNNFNIYSMDKFISNSYKVGIEIDPKSRMTKNEHLYRMDMVEFNLKNWSYLLDIDIKEKINDKGTVKIGGEGKTGTYEFLKEKPYDLEMFFEKINNKTNKVKIFFITPAILEDGCKICFENNEKIKNIASVIGKPSFIGGYDVKVPKEKTMKKAIPAGSIFILESDEFIDKSLKEIKECLTGENKNCSNEKITNFSKEQLIRGFDRFIVIPFEEELR